MSGHIIGKTKSGKDVYQSWGQQQNFGSIRGWTAEDAAEIHRDAALVAEGKKLDRAPFFDRRYRPPKTRTKTHNDSADSHAKMANRIAEAYDRLRGLRGR